VLRSESGSSRFEEISDGHADVPAECERLLSLVSSAANDSIEQIEKIPSHIDKEISLALSALQRGEKYEANIMLKLDEPPHMQKIQEEFDRLSRISEF